MDCASAGNVPWRGRAYDDDVGYFWIAVIAISISPRRRPACSSTQWYSSCSDRRSGESNSSGSSRTAGGSQRRSSCRRWRRRRTRRATPDSPERSVVAPMPPWRWLISNGGAGSSTDALEVRSVSTGAFIHARRRSGRAHETPAGRVASSMLDAETPVRNSAIWVGVLWIMATAFPVASILPWSVLDDGGGILANAATHKGCSPPGRSSPSVESSRQPEHPWLHTFRAVARPCSRRPISPWRWLSQSSRRGR